jgi:restriction system protein
LLLDYEDFLRQRGKRQWAKDDAEAKAVRAVGKSCPSCPTYPSDPTDQSDNALYVAWLRNNDSAVVANAIICLIHQANYLLDRQIAGLERGFINEGGYSESLAAARLQVRKQQNRNDLSDRTDQTNKGFPTCPLCGKTMVLRTARQGKNVGSQFLGCSGYPACKGTVPI